MSPVEHQVIVIDDDGPVQSQPAKPPVDVIVIGDSENTDAVATSPRHPPTTPPATTTRFSDLFEEFRAKWGKRDSVNGRTRISDLLGDRDRENIVVETTPDADSLGIVEYAGEAENILKKGKRKTGTKNKEPKQKKPRSKIEALNTIEMVIDDRLTVNTAAFPENMRVTRERLPFEHTAVIWRDGESGEVKELIVLVLEMSDELINDHKSVISSIIEETRSYKKRLILLTNFKQFSTDYEKRIQKNFTKAVKDNRRFSGSAAVDLTNWHHQLSLYCTRRDTRLFTVGTHGAISTTIEPHLVEWSKALAWTASTKPATKPVKCGKDDADTFRRMLECVPRTPIVVIDALVRRFITFRRLVEEVRVRGRGGVERITVNEQRTVGAAVAEKLHFIFTSDNLQANINL